MKYLLLFIFIISCSPRHVGDLGEVCKPDGTCNGATLTCGHLSKECEVKVVLERSKCVYESECFCITCSEKCGEAGVKKCQFTDTSIFGSSGPSICECK